jgi:hypothetical protein
VLFRRVAREDFKVVRPMLDALRTNDAKALLKYDDLLPLQAHVDKVVASSLQATPVVQANPAAAEPVDVPVSDDGIDSIRKALRSLGVADDVADVLIAEAVNKNPSADPLLLLSVISERLIARPVKIKKPSIKKPSKDDDADALDLRHIVAIGKKSGQSAHQSLMAAGLVKPPLLDFAA